MNFITTNLSGAYIIEPQVFADERGYFFESYHQAKFAQNGITATFVQDNESRSTMGVMRGLHAQEGGFAQAKLIRVLSGTILDIGVDVHQEAELTICLSDPDLEITWPFALTQAIISKKDQHGISLRTWLKQQHLIPRYRPDLAS